MKLGREIACLLLASLVLIGCDGRGPAVRIEGQCVSEMPARRLLSYPELRGPDGLFVLAPSVGVLDGATMLEWMAPYSLSATTDLADYIAWFDADGSLTVGPTWLGAMQPAPRSALSRVGPDLVAQRWTDPSGSPAGEVEDNVALWHFAPSAAGGVVDRVAVDLPINRVPACPDCPMTSLAFGGALYAGSQGALPVVSAGRAVALVSAIPEACATAADDGLRVMAFDDAGDAALVNWLEESCRLMPYDEVVVSNLNAVTLDDGNIGVLFRLGAFVGHGHVHYLRISPEFELLGGPWLVGNQWIHTPLDTGYQPKLVAVGEANLLFTERVDWDLNSCVVLRVLRQEGAEVQAAYDAPWQLPCVRDPERYYTPWHELVPLADGYAAIVWSERNAFGRSAALRTVVTTDVEWEEGIYMAMLSPEGRRASEIVRVTDDAATALNGVRRAESGPFSTDFELTASSEGDAVTVAWFDNRAEAPGAYAARFRCERTE